MRLSREKWDKEVKKESVNTQPTGRNQARGKYTLSRLSTKKISLLGEGFCKFSCNHA
jgi:hypothetical protein